MKPTVLGIVIVLALLATGAIFLANDAFAPQQAPVAEQTYANDVYGISFAYPAGYVLSEQEAGDAERRHYAISIINEADAVPRVNSEGPTAISIDIYENDTDPLSLSEWVTTAAESNYRLGDGMLASTTLDGHEAVSYAWSGLYEGETTAFLSGDKVIAVSVTYMSPADQIYLDYLVLLSSLRLR